MSSTEINSNTEKAIVFEYKSLTGAQGETAGLIVDSAGFGALDFVMEGGIISNGAPNAFYSIALKESDTTSNFLEVDPQSIVTTNNLIFASNQTVSVGYIGKKRFVRADINRTGGAFGATIDCIGITVVGAVPLHIPSAALIII